ncbi:MAG: alanyl-tRNA editing protein [Alphaproteobacteria bacterium]|jgi:misacylated tRNA(Ala) deacylase|nr:alanyl-tRNA editing protein [Alphaproteobacteria bacterium]
MTELLFRDDAYAQSSQARVIGTDERGIRLDRTVFYARGGGQPGDTGWLDGADGSRIEIVDTVKDGDDILHVPAEAAVRPAIGDSVTASIDWPRRHRLMRAHSALHLLSSLVDGAVTGGSVGLQKSRFDFDLPDTALDKEALGEALNRLIAEDHPVNARWISDAELDANPDLVKTMSVAPPRGAGQVRLIEVAGIDLQACGGTHVARTGEIGQVRIGKIENKGRHNRRINVLLVDE